MVRWIYIRYPASLSLRGAQLTQVNITAMLRDERVVFPEAPPLWQLTGNTIASRNAPRIKARCRRKKITMQPTFNAMKNFKEWWRCAQCVLKYSAAGRRGHPNARYFVLVSGQ